MSKCSHIGKTEVRRDEVLVDGEWIPGTTYTRCADCKATVMITSNKGAFYSPNTPRRQGEWREEQ